MKKYIEVSDKDEIVLVDSKSSKAKYNITFESSNILVKKSREKFNRFFSISEIDVDTLTCISSLDSLICNSSNQSISNEILKQLNDLRDYLYSKVNDKNKVSYENLIDTKYYKVSSYTK